MEKKIEEKYQYETSLIIYELIKQLLILLIIVIIFFFIKANIYVVNPNETVVIRQFARIKEVKDKTGLYFKIPLVQSKQRISNKSEIYDVPKSDVITKDKKSLIADSYVIYKIKDTTKYIRSVNAIKERMLERLEASTYNTIKKKISSMTQDEIIKARGETLTTSLTEEVNKNMENYGIEISQVQIKVLDLPDDNKNAVYERMISERNNIAASFKAKGESDARIIKNETDKEVNLKISEAKKEAEIIKAEGENEYMKILKDAYNTEEKADFYNYIRGLDALKNSLAGKEDKTIILDKDSELARILYNK